MTIKQIRLYVFNRDSWRCVVCGQKIDWSTGQLAHRIPKTKGNIKRYGFKIIDHPLNLKTTCSLKCNSAVLIEHSPIEKEQLIAMIKTDNSEGA